MQMYQFFWCGVEIDDFIFKGVNISGWKDLYEATVTPISLLLDMLITCSGTALLAFLFFTVTFCKEMLHSSISAQHQGQAFVRDAQILQVWTSSWKMHIFQTISTLIQITSGYFLMLIVMSFNVYLMLAVVIGSTSGYFALHPLLLKKQSILNPPHILMKCQAEECGSLLIEGEQAETLRGRNSRDNSDASKQLIVSASIQHHSN
uniref:Copper transport protein n=1 Tax=Daphnia galeata TaxID=27404 RepID=A0A8J2WVN0_9CRUS|nr:unnamed protein product [Daphnia galeata]